MGGVLFYKQDIFLYGLVSGTFYPSSPCFH